MIIAEMPVDEKFRLLELASYDILDTAAETDFNELVELAADICNCPISLITLLDEDRQWFKAKHGVTTAGTTRDVAFCSHAILQDDVMVVEDSLKDERFFDNPLVTGEENVRFYAGAPIFSTNGYKLGTLCVIDNAPKKLSEKEQRAMSILSNQITKLLELRKKNALLRQRAAEIIALKSSTIESIIKKQEHEKNEIAHNLHEDIAQRLSSVMLYLKMAKKNDGKNEEYMQIADSQMKETLEIVRNLSYSITPHTQKWIHAEVLIAEFVEKTSETYPFKVVFKIVDEEIKKTAENALVAIRIMELWLKFIADQANASQVILTLHCTDKIDVTIENDGSLIDFEKQKQYIFESSMFERATACEGVIDLNVNEAGANVLTFSIAGKNIAKQFVTAQSQH